MKLSLNILGLAVLAATVSFQASASPIQADGKTQVFACSHTDEKSNQTENCDLTVTYGQEYVNDGSLVMTCGGSSGKLNGIGTTALGAKNFMGTLKITSNGPGRSSLQPRLTGVSIPGNTRINGLGPITMGLVGNQVDYNCK